MLILARHQNEGQRFILDDKLQLCSHITSPINPFWLGNLPRLRNEKLLLWDCDHWEPCVISRERWFSGEFILEERAVAGDRLSEYESKADVGKKIYWDCEACSQEKRSKFAAILDRMVAKILENRDPAEARNAACNEATEEICQTTPSPIASFERSRIFRMMSALLDGEVNIINDYCTTRRIPQSTRTAVEHLTSVIAASKQLSGDQQAQCEERISKMLGQFVEQCAAGKLWRDADVLGAYNEWERELPPQETFWRRAKAEQLGRLYDLLLADNRPSKDNLRGVLQRLIPNNMLSEDQISTLDQKYNHQPLGCNETIHAIGCQRCGRKSCRCWIR